MSANRSPWDDEEEALLKQILFEMPSAKLSEIHQAFEARNHRKRTPHAIKAKRKDLGLSVKRGE
jgi:hypothetical protein